MPSLVALLRVATFTAFVALFVALTSAPAHAAEDVVDALFLPSITLDGAFGVQWLASPDTPPLAPSDAPPENVFLVAGSIRLPHTIHRHAGVARTDAILSESTLGGIFQTETHPIRSSVWNGTSWLASWTTATLPEFGMRLRTSGIIGSFMTERLRVNTPGGDRLYSSPGVMVFSASGTHLPESRTWPLMLAGIFVMAAIVRRHLRRDLPE